MDTRKDIENSEIVEQLRYTSIHNLIENDQVFRVPSFQRFFVWDEENVKRFFKDLIDSAPDEEIFLGDLLLKEEDGEDAVKVIDGQQRIAVVLIMMRVLSSREELSENKKEDLKEILDGIDYKYSRLDLQQEDMRNYFNSRIIQGKSKSEANYEEISHYNPVQKVESALQWFEDNLEKEIDNSEVENLNDFVDYLENKAGAIVVKIERDEYEIFDSINSKGRPLEPADKIKTFFLKRSEQENQHEVEESWNNIYERFDFDSSEVSRFLRTYYESRKGQKKDLYKRFRNLIDKDDETPLDLANEVENYSIIYKKVVNPEDDWSKLEKRFLINLDFMGFKTPYRLIIQVAKMYEDNDKEYQNQNLFRKLLRNLDKFFFIKRIIGGKHPQTLKDRMTEWSMEIYTCDDLQTMKDKIREYNSILEDKIEEDLESDFEYTLKDRSSERSDLSEGKTNYGGFKKKTIFYILFRVYIERSERGTTRNENIEEWKSEEVEDQTIEHVMPIEMENWEEYIKQNFLEDWSEEHENLTVENEEDQLERYREILTDDLGNHTVLLRVANSKVNNRSFEEKKSIYKGKWDEVDIEPSEEEYVGESGNPLFEYILKDDTSDWGPKEIEQRRRQLIEDLKESLKPGN